MELPRLTEQIRKKKSFLCVGLDVDLNKVPKHLLKEDDPLFAFAKAIIDATHEHCVAYKPNTAFFEAYGSDGWRSLEKIANYLHKNYPNHFTIADAKRGDIGNTSTRYAKAFFEAMNFDSVTVAPYMGRDSVEPFLAFENKYAILLGLTSNNGSADFQQLKAKRNYLFEHVLETAKTYQNSDRLMYVVGATKAESLSKIRKIIPESFLLVPGVGAQGGDLEEVCKYGMNDNVGLLVNSSRGIIYAGSGRDFAIAAQTAARDLQRQMAAFL